jgi:hypothetical protein
MVAAHGCATCGLAADAGSDLAQVQDRQGPRESRLSVSVSKVPRTSEWLIDRPKVSVQTIIIMRYGDPIDLGIDRAGMVQPVYLPY